MDRSLAQIARDAFGPAAREDAEIALEGPEIRFDDELARRAGYRAVGADAHVPALAVMMMVVVIRLGPCGGRIIGMEAIAQDLVEGGGNPGLLIDPMAVIAQHLDALHAAADILLDLAVDGAGPEHPPPAGFRLFGRGEADRLILRPGTAQRQGQAG